MKSRTWKKKKKDAKINLSTIYSRFDLCLVDATVYPSNGVKYFGTKSFSVHFNFVY